MKRNRVLCLLAAVVVAASLLFSARAGAQQSRVALLIANSAYPETVPPLASPRGSAQALGEELRRSRFDVDLRENLDKDGMRKALDAFMAKLGPGSAGFFFFSGFGIAAGENYLVPVNVQIWTEGDLKRDGVSVEAILREMDNRGAKAKFVVLDASRRNPFERRFHALSGGLGPLAAPPGSLIMSAAAAGRVLPDGESGSSLFVGELVKEMRAPDRGVEDIFSRTRLGVMNASKNEQVPQVAAALSEDFRFGSASNAEARPLGGGANVRARAPDDLKSGVIFRDCAECPELVVLPTGRFEMGSNEFDAEKPVHAVVVAKPFAIGRSEVTYGQWDACVAAGACSYRPDDHGRGRLNLPATEVSWADAKTYVAWLSQRTGQNYRLPSEAEWEYAARGGASTPFWWGREPGSSQANCRTCGGVEETRAAGSYPANPFGLFDTAGNAAEWVEDCWNDSYRGAGSSLAPRETGFCRQRVVRGGSFDAGARYVRSASRFLYDAHVRYYANGFRVVREIP